MNINFHMPVRIIGGVNCISQNRDYLRLGKSCMIVTGKSSAIKSGALDDVIEALGDLEIEFIIYDSITENPLLSTVYDGGIIAKNYGCDFVIGIGGGSPMDAAKAIAAFAANDSISPNEIFDVSKLKKSLPIVEIPTTSGTGSEANPYSILSLDGLDCKKTFNSPYSYAAVAFLDPKYTYTLSAGYSMSTALDAFCHCFESYLSPKSTEESRMFALFGAKSIWECLDALKSGVISESAREKLMYASFAGGVAINTTGTGFPHPMGYNLTFYGNVPHGRACGVFAEQYVKYQSMSEDGRELLNKFASELKTTPETVGCEIAKASDVCLKLDADTIISFAEKIKTAGNFANAQYKISYEEVLQIYKDLFLK